MKKIFLLLFTSVFFVQCRAQKIQKTDNTYDTKRPKLVLGIVIDQMRYDYLIKFYNKYSEGGFKRLMNMGYNCENTHFNYIPTYTAVGHTSIYTGTTPSMHGIIANNWYDKKLKKSIYCVDDNRYKTIGADKGGDKSPYRLQTTTVTDQLKLVVKNKAKVIGISIKDRAAILPAGHAADAAYWFRGKKTAKFISSSYYMDELPEWVKRFNASNTAQDLLKVWNPLYNIDTYTESIADNNSFEGRFEGEETPTFPHDLPKLMEKNGKYSILKTSPFGNTLLESFAESTIEGEQLGQDDITDFLTISFSSTDYIGHKYGPDSKEVEDTYLRLDKDIEKLLNYLDTHVGGNNYSLFLTADHAVVPVPSYLQSLKINAGYFDTKAFETYLNEITTKYFNSNEIIENFSNFQIFLDKDKIEELHLDYDKVTRVIKNKAILVDWVYKAVTAETLQTTEFSKGVLSALQNGYNQKYSGDIMVIPMPAMLPKHYEEKNGSAHGTAYNYDTHVPLLFFGQGFPKGSTNKHINITDIAPTISNLLHIEFPNANSGKIIEMD